MIHIVRWILTIALIYGVYTETGKWTALALFLITLTIELITGYLMTEKRKSKW